MEGVGVSDCSFLAEQQSEVPAKLGGSHHAAHTHPEGQHMCFCAAGEVRRDGLSES